MSQKLFHQQRGFVVLMSTIVTGAVGVAVAVSLILLGLGAGRTSLALEQGNQAKALANACVERGLDSLRQDLNYNGSETITLGQGSCNILPVLGSGNSNRTIQATGTVGTIVRKVEVGIATVQPQMILQFWQEMADF